MRQLGKFQTQFIRIRRYHKFSGSRHEQLMGCKFMVKERRTMEENKHSSLGLSDNDVLEMYKKMLLARKIDERMWLLNRSGKIPFVISCQGQEAAQVGAAFALDQKRDYVAPYYRDLGIVLKFGMTTRDLMLSGFAKEEDPNSAGRQMPGHFGQKKNRIITGSSPVTTQLPHAVGFALAAKIKKQDFVTLTTLGDGSTNQGDFHEGLNFAGVHNLILHESPLDSWNRHLKLLA